MQFCFTCILIHKSESVAVVREWLKQHWSMFSCNTDYVFFSNAFSSELDRCCCIWHLVLLITHKPLEHDFLRKLCIKLVCEIVTKRFVFKHGQLEYILKFCHVLLVNYNTTIMILSLKPFSLLGFGCFGFFWFCFWFWVFFFCILHVGNTVFSGTFYLCFLGSMLHGVLDHGYHCNGWSNIFFNGIKTAIWSLM